MDIGTVIKIGVDNQTKVCIIIDKKFGRDMDDRLHNNFFQGYAKPFSNYDFYIRPEPTMVSDWFHVYSMTMFYELMYGDEKAYIRSDILEKYVEKI